MSFLYDPYLLKRVDIFRLQGLCISFFDTEELQLLCKLIVHIKSRGLLLIIKRVQGFKDSRVQVKTSD